MSAELTLLTWSATLVGAHVVVQAILYRLDVGTGFAAGPRDGERQLKPLTQRAEKALRNLLETYAVFVALAVATALSGRSDGLTSWGAQVYFWARWAYLPAYLSGIPYLRSAIWTVSAGGLVAMFLGVAF